MTGPHWIKQWIANLALLNEQFRDENGTVDFEALGREEFLFRTALITRNFSKSERAREAYESATVAYNANVANGKKGGRPRKQPEENPEARESRRTGGDSVKQGQCSIVSPVRSIPMPTTEQLYDFARTEGLDETDAREWWEMTVVDRDGKDRYGKPIANWKAACRKFCAAKTQRRNA